jgi:predicted nucleic acid-binding protein
VSKMTRRVYLDTGVLITAWRGRGSAGLIALEVLDDPGLVLVVSDAVWLEIMPKPLHEKRRDEAEFYQAVFDRAERLPWSLDVLGRAHDLARQHGIAAMDAIHAAFAVAHRVDELITTERPERPLFRIEQLTISSLRSGAP